MNVDVGLTVTFFNNATKGLQSLSGDVKKVGDNAQATANRLKAIQVVIAGILIDKTLEWGKALVEVAASTQNLDLRLAAFAGGAEKAHSVFNTLSTEFAATPFKIDGITASWIKLRSAFNSNDQTTKVLEAIVNDVAAMGGKDENIDNLAASLQRMFATGIASSREYKTLLTQTGLTIGDLAKAAGTKGQEFATSLQRGFMSASTFINSFVKASKDRFGFFASDLQHSVGGAFNLLSNTFNKAMSDIGERTNLNAHLTVFFQNLATAITKVMGAISQKDIDHFFDWLAKIAPLVVNTVTGVANLAVAIIDLAADIGNLLGHMSSEMIEFGVLGYFLFGKKGAIILAMIPALARASQAAGSSLSNLDAKAAAAGTNSYQALKKYYESQGGILSTMFAPERAGLDLLYGRAFQTGNKVGAAAAKGLAAFAGIGNGNSPLGNLFGDPKQIQAEMDKWKNFVAGFAKNGLGGSGGGDIASTQLLDALRAANQMTQTLSDTFDQVGDHIKQIDFKNVGDELGASLQAIQLEGDSVTKSIDGSIKSEAMLNIHTAANLALVRALKGERAQIEKSIAAAVQREKEIYAIQQKQFVLQQQIAAAQNNFQASQASLHNGINKAGWYEQALMGTDGGQKILDFMQQQQALKDSIASIDSQILTLELQLKEVAADPAKVTAIKANEASLNRLKTATQDTLDALSVTGQMENEFWKELGNTLNNDLADGITGLLEGTKSLGDVARSVFSDMISMAVKYLIQLLEIKAISAVVGLFGDGGVIPGGVSPFANGGINTIGGNTKAFANGDILTGPTLFGLAGEAGTEAIMPLTRIGGKLGVRSEGGGGGGATHIHIHAIDTQTGMEFLMKHMDTISGGLAQRNRLNRTSK